jgi:hypothetical protein
MRLKNVLSYLPAILLLIAIMLKFIDDTNIYSNATKVAEPVSGHTVKVPQHGYFIFLTLDQLERQKPGHWSNLLIAALAVLVIVQKVADK